MRAILIFSADEHVRETLKSALADRIPLIVTENKKQCLAAARQKGPLHKAFINVDRKNPGLFEELAALRPELKLIAIGDHDTEEKAIEAVRHGAAGYILLPLTADAILAAAR